MSRSISPQRPVPETASPGQQSIIFHDVDNPLTSIDDLQLTFQSDLSSGCTEAQALAALSIVSGALDIDPAAAVTAGADSDFNAEWFIGPAIAAQAEMYTTWKMDASGFGYGGYVLAGFYHYPDDETTVPERPTGSTYGDNGFCGGGIGADYGPTGGGTRKVVYTSYRNSLAGSSNSSNQWNRIMTSVCRDLNTSYVAYSLSSTRATAEEGTSYNWSQQAGGRRRLEDTHRFRAALRITRDPDQVQNYTTRLHALELHYNVKV